MSARYWNKQAPKGWEVEQDADGMFYVVDEDGERISGFSYDAKTVILQAIEKPSVKESYLNA